MAGLTNVEIATCTKLEATAAEPVPVQADGDIVGSLPVTLSIHQVPLKFC